MRIRLWMAEKLMRAGALIAPAHLRPVAKTSGRLMRCVDDQSLDLGRTGGIIIVPWAFDAEGFMLAGRMMTASKREADAIRNEAAADSPPSDWKTYRWEKMVVAISDAVEKAASERTPEPTP